MAYTIVLADNDPIWLAVCVHDFEKAGFRVLTADNSAALEALLATSRVHLVVVDRRLDDNADNWDTSGEELAKRYRGPLPFVLMTIFELKFSTLADLMLVGPNKKPDVAYIFDKARDLSELIAIVRQLLEDQAPIKWDLNIPPTDRGQILAAIAPDRLVHNATVLDGELNDLLGILFREHRTLNYVRTLARADGYSLLQLDAQRSDPGPGERPIERVLLLAGRREAVAPVLASFERFSRSQWQALRMRDRHERPLLAGAVLTYAGDLEQVVSLNDYCRQQSLERVLAAIEGLAMAVLTPSHGPAAWVAAGASAAPAASVAPVDVALAELGGEQMARRIAEICRAASEPSCHLEFDPQANLLRVQQGNELVTLPNPARTLARLADRHDSLLSRRGPTLGAADPRLILVDEQSGQCLIWDYSRVERSAPFLADLAQLAMGYRAATLRSLGPGERFQIEWSLLFATAGPAGQRAEQALEVLRTIQGYAVARAGGDLRTWQLTQLLFAVRTLIGYDLEHGVSAGLLPGYANLLILGGLLARELSRGLDEQQGLSFDPATGQPLIDGRPARTRLTPGDLKLLYYLFSRVNTLCPRIDICCAWAIDEPKDPAGLTKEQERAILGENSGKLEIAVNRIRKAIEPNPAKHIFLVSSRGLGYTLFLRPQEQQEP